MRKRIVTDKNPSETKGKSKIIRRFKLIKSVDRQIQKWAKMNGFTEGNPTGQHLMDENNHAYCYYKKIDRKMICVVVDTLDQMIQVETWMMDEIRSEHDYVYEVMRLFEVLGQPTNEFKKFPPQA